MIEGFPFRAPGNVAGPCNTLHEVHWGDSDVPLKIEALPEEVW